MIRRTNRGPTFVAVLALVAVAACSQSPASSATAGGTGTPSSGSPSTMPPASAAGPGTTAGASTIRACDLLSDADVESITGYGIASKDDDPPDTTYPSACQWKFEGNNWELALGVLPEGGQDFYDRSIQLEGATPIAGLGDKAARTDVSEAIMVVVGDTLLDLQYVAFGEPDGIDQRLAERAVANLGS